MAGGRAEGKGADMRHLSFYVRSHADYVRRLDGLKPCNWRLRSLRVGNGSESLELQTILCSPVKALGSKSVWERLIRALLTKTKEGEKEKDRYPFLPFHSSAVARCLSAQSTLSLVGRLSSEGQTRQNDDDGSLPIRDFFPRDLPQHSPSSASCNSSSNSRSWSRRLLSLLLVLGDRHG